MEFTKRTFFLIGLLAFFPFSLRAMDFFTAGQKEIRELRQELMTVVNSPELNFYIKNLHRFNERPDDMALREALIDSILAYKLRFGTDVERLEQKLAMAVEAEGEMEQTAKKLEDLSVYAHWTDKLLLIFKPELFVPLAESGLVSPDFNRKGVEATVTRMMDLAVDQFENLYIKLNAHYISGHDRLRLIQDFREHEVPEDFDFSVSCREIFSVDGH